ncbi:MAG: hypothetical protein K1X92_15445 [Bacteroidia bacterium]|nr:hypothetical protein [Bacteroidia bacterium]
MKKTIIYLLFSGLFIQALSQTTPPALNGNYYDLLLAFHTRGFSTEGRYTFGQGNFRWCAGLNISTMKGNKEIRIRSLYMDVQDGSRFVFDKMNRLLTISPEFGVSRNLLPKSYYNKVELIGGLQAGLTFGFLRPYYLYVAMPDPSRPGLNIITETVAEPDKYSYPEIVGEVVPWKFLTPARIMPGLSLKTFATINMNRYTGIIRGIDLTCRVQVFFQKVPIMYSSPNQASFVTFGVGFINGKKFTNR